jgi:glycosyltransferase involved in cell wall biosynthesis
MKIAGIVHTLNVHGGVRRYIELGNALVDAGHEYTLFYKPLQEKVPWMEFKGKAVPNHIYHGQKFDLAFTGADECFGALERIDARVKVVFVVAKFYADSFKRMWRKHGNKYLWVGVAKEWNVGMEEIQGVTIPGGVNTDFFVPKKRLPLLGRKMRVGFYSRLGFGRGVEDIVYIAGKFRVMGRDAFDFIGFDARDYDATLKDGINGIKVIRTPTQESLRDCLQSCDVVLSLMCSAGWNNVVAEGMACGALPIATTAGNGDLIIDGQTGFIVDKPRHARKYLVTLQENPAQVEMIAQNAIKHVQQFSWKTHAEKFIDEVERRMNERVECHCSNAPNRLHR